ncbi:porin [Tateyamaria sp.]|uniref:porin n=1 Tax=Tateyamaria sp. TaxID=1929288 RepID=UPI0032A0420C
MKKVLIATTALVGSAGMAAAEISFAGAARFGLTYVEDRTDDAGLDAETVIEQRLRFTVTGQATSDNGLEFEARIRAESGESSDNSIGGNDGGFGAAGFAVSTGGLRLDVGNVSDVLDSGDTLNLFGFGVGFTSFIEQNSNSVGIPSNGFGAGDADQTNIKLRYNVGDFTISASFSNNTSVITELDEDNAVNGVANDIDEYQIGVGYSFGDYRIGAAFGSEDGDTVTRDAATGAVTSVEAVDNDFWAIGFDGSVGAVDFAAVITDSDEADDATFGFSLDYDVSAVTSIRFAASTGGDDDSDTSYGIGATHSLGGGVTLAGGIGSNSSGNTVADLGVTFGF